MEEFSGFADLVRTRTAKTPERTCLLVAEDGEVRPVTWRSFNERVEARARELACANASCEAIVAAGGTDCLIEVFACALARVQSALIGSFETDAETARLISACDADALWAPERRRRALEPALLQARPRTDEPRSASPGGILFFTSGTASRAKAVQLTDASLMASAWHGASLLPLANEDALLCALPISHVFGFVCGILWGMQCNVPVALGRGIRRFADDFALFRPTAVPLVPTLAKWALEAGALAPSVRLVLLGAAPCPPSLAERLRAAGGAVSSGYGLTESSSGIALSRGPDASALDICPRTEVRIGKDDEVLVRAPDIMMRGYYRDAESTAQTLCDGWLRTGDAGFIDGSGRLHVRGRIKDVIALENGTKLFLPEYEQACKDALHEGNVAVVDVNGRPVLACGKLTGHLGSSARDAERAIERELAALMASYPRESQVVRAIELGHALPRTAAGDVQRWKVKKELERWQPKKK